MTSYWTIWIKLTQIHMNMYETRSPCDQFCIPSKCWWENRRILWTVGVALTIKCSTITFVTVCSSSRIIRLSVLVCFPLTVVQSIITTFLPSYWPSLWLLCVMHFLWCCRWCNSRATIYVCMYVCKDVELKSWLISLVLCWLSWEQLLSPLQAVTHFNVNTWQKCTQ